MKTISVIVPVLNGEGTISRCLSSIQSQQLDQVDVIVVDGLSSDGTLKIIKDEFSGLVNHLISEKDGGQSHAINKGFRLAQGDVICWLCADDEFAQGALFEVQSAFANNPKLDIFSGACRRFFSSGEYYLRNVDAESWRRVGYNNEFDQPSMFWSRKIYESIGGVNEDLKVAMDWDYWNRMKEISPTTQTTRSILSHYYFSDSNKTSLNPELHLKETRMIVRRYAPNGDLVLKLYDHLFANYDMKGCYDSDIKTKLGTRALRKSHHEFLYFAKKIFDEDIVNHYNWNWISKMLREEVG